MLNLPQVRAHLHRIPERGFAEFKTHAYIESLLKQYSALRLHTFPFPGLVAEYSHGDGPYRLFRADMDALPLHERSGCAFPSQHEGMMHACGHDVHMTVLLGLIHRICQEKLPGNYLFVFQPAEEGLGGATRLLESGVLERFSIGACYALHVSGKYPVGTVATRAGIFFGIPQEFKLTFQGVSAHAAFPENGRNALHGGIQFYQAMRLAMAQSFSPTSPTVFHVGRFDAGRVMNAVPDLCVLEGTTRCLRREHREAINGLMDNAARHAAETFGLAYTLELLSGYDPVVNDAALLEHFVRNLPQGVRFIEAPTVMTGEDFGFFTSRWPGVLFWLGGGEHSGDLHADTFFPDEACLQTGVDVMYAMAASEPPKNG